MTCDISIPTRGARPNIPVVWPGKHLYQSTVAKSHPEKSFLSMICKSPNSSVQGFLTLSDYSPDSHNSNSSSCSYYITCMHWYCVLQSNSLIWFLLISQSLKIILFRFYSITDLADTINTGVKPLSSLPNKSDHNKQVITDNTPTSCRTDFETRV